MDHFNLTTPQKNIWNLQKYYENTAISNLCGAVFFEEEHDLSLLQKAINHVIKNQTALRLRFVQQDGEIKQYIKEYAHVETTTHEFTDENEFDAYARDCAKKPIGLLDCVMYRFEIVSIGKQQGILAVLSHLVSDAWTFNLLVKEIDEVYGELVKRKSVTCEENDYQRYVQAEADYFNSDKYKKDEHYWQKKYEQKPELSLIKISTSSKNIVNAKRVERKLAIALTNDIKNYCMKKFVSPAVLFETALYTYLIKINSEHNAVTIGVPVLNRTKAYEKNTAGMFISTVPLTVTVSEEDTIQELMERITDEHTQVFRHQKYPYSMILKYLREKQNFEGNLYDVMFSFQNAEIKTKTMTKWYCNGASEVPFVLHVDNRDGNNTYTLTVDYQIDLFKDEKEVQDILNRFEYIMRQLIEKEDARLKDISILPEEEKRRVLYDFNDTTVDYPRDKCVHELFMEQVQKTPEAIAVVFEEKEITYQELDEMSNVLAHLLCEKGVKRGDIVPIIAKRSWHIIVAMLGILKAGAAYMPIAPDYPKDRVQFIINEARSRIGCVLGYEEELENVELLKLDEIDFDSNALVWKVSINYKNQLEDICYVIFTSGSTGVPKGVMITHGNLMSYLMQAISNYGIERYDMSLITNIYVDLSVTTLFLPLVTGYSLEIVDLELKDSIKHIMQRSNGVYKLTPTHLDMVQTLHISLPSDATFILGGEALKKEHVELICKQNRLIDEYGPTETTVGCCIKKYEKGNKEKYFTIGRSIANNQIYILDKQNNPLPIGVPGELCISGAGVGLGYLNRLDLTAERFVENPFATEENGHGKTMYHTGDLAAWRENGEIEYLGRIDTQVKIRGLRIELGEIESVMSEFPGIRMCAVTDKKDEDSRQYLVGYYTNISDEKEDQNVITAAKVDEKELRKYLSSKLPKYMVPNYFMHISKIPMTASGKTDRKNLPMPKISESTLQEYIEPITEQECTLCYLMETVLGYKPIGREHDFFFCGGDSLKAMEFIIKAEAKGIQIQLQDIFDYPTVAELTAFLQAKHRREQEDILNEYSFERFEKYQPILENNKIFSNYDMQEVSVKKVLLSGITGFLGVHIADSLLQEEDRVIYCLVRSKESEDRRGRLLQILEHYFGNKYTDVIGTRIIPITGDITNAKLSDELPEKVDTIIHVAATVKHYGSYEYFYEVNVLGTKHMAEYALKMGARFIHVSTISVSGNSLVDNFDTEITLEERYFSEACLYQGQSLSNVYVRSKFEAECVVLDAMLRGLQANIIRVGNLTNCSKDYIFQPNYRENAFLSRVKAALELGYLPDYMMSLYSEFSPVDDTADAIVRIVKHFNTKYTVFHVYSDQNLYFDRMVEILKELYFDIQVVDGEMFIECLKETVNQNREHIYKAFLNDMTVDGKLNYESNIHIQNEFTISYLKQLGFEWTKIDLEYIKGYLDYFMNLGYLEV